MPVRYTIDAIDLTEVDTAGFFVGWPDPPNDATFRRILRDSTKTVIALDENRLVGFCTAVSDGVLTAFIPLLEVLPDYQRQGIGSELVRQMIESLSPIYAIDLVCDEDMTSFYERFGLQRMTAMSMRNYLALNAKT